MPYRVVPSSLFHESPKKPYLPGMIDVVKCHTVELLHQFAPRAVSNTLAAA